MPLNVNEWLSDLQKKGSLSPQELSAVKDILTKPAVSQEISDAFERQSDYSRKMAELQALKAQEDDYATRLAAWESDVKTQLAQSQTTAQQYQQKFYELAAKYGVSPEELQEAMKTQSPTSPTPTPANGASGISKEEIDNQAAALFRLNAKVIGLNQKHISLYGKPMENIDEFVDHALRAGKPVEETFRDFYKVADRERELNELDVQRRIDEAVNKAKTDWVAQGANPFSSNGNKPPQGHQSPIFENVPDIGEKMPGDHAAHRTRVNEVIAAFQLAESQST